MSQTGSVFSPEQLICLRNQIMVFRTLKVTDQEGHLSLNPRSCHVKWPIVCCVLLLKPQGAEGS